MKSKVRLDQILVLRGFAKNRSHAQALVMSGKVYSGDRCLKKAGHQYENTVDLDIRGKEHQWASRGGIKLAHAIKKFGVKPAGKLCIDIGASTGGFTDVLLCYGAAGVYAVDVGFGQLAWKLRTNKKVHVIEKFNARYLSEEQIDTKVDLLVVDVSFISLEKVLPPAFDLTKDCAELIALIKPQFEVTKSDVGKRGVIRDPVLHNKVCEKIGDWINNYFPWRVKSFIKSPIAGPAGNLEFFVHAEKVG